MAKSGNNLNFLFLRCLIEAFINSIKLWGKIFVDRPTAIPSAPCARSRGNFTGKFIGSFLLPSYDDCQSVTFGLKTTSNANLDNLASIYLEAAALSPVNIFPQLPWVSINKSF